MRASTILDRPCVFSTLPSTVFLLDPESPDLCTQASHGSRREGSLWLTVHEKGCCLSLPSLRTHHALHVLTTSVLPEQRRHHRRRSRASRALDTFAMNQTNGSICSCFVDVRTTGSSRVPSRPPFAQDVRVFLSSGDTPSLHELPRRSSILACSSWVGRSVRPNTLSSREPQHGRLLHGVAKADTQVRTILGDSCDPISGSDSTSFHLSQQTVTPHVLSPVRVLTFSSHLCTNDIVQRKHRMSLDPRPRLPVCLSISIWLLS